MNWIFMLCNRIKAILGGGDLWRSQVQLPTQPSWPQISPLRYNPPGEICFLISNQNLQFSAVFNSYPLYGLCQHWEDTVSVILVTTLQVSASFHWIPFSLFPRTKQLPQFFLAGRIFRLSTIITVLYNSSTSLLNRNGTRGQKMGCKWTPYSKCRLLNIK